MTLDKAPVGMAEPVADLQGFNNIFRDGDIYFAGQPNQDALRDSAARGVKVVVNIRADAEMSGAVDFDELALVEKLNMRYVHIPVTPATLSIADADRLHDVLSSTTAPLLVHCGSSNRVGGLWALYLHRHRGLDLDEALKRGRQAGLRSESITEAVKRAAAAK